MINFWFLSLGVSIIVLFIQMLLISASEFSNSGLVFFFYISELKGYNNSTERLIIFNKNICTRSFQEHVNVQESKCVHH